MDDNQIRDVHLARELGTDYLKAEALVTLRDRYLAVRDGQLKSEGIRVSALRDRIARLEFQRCYSISGPRKGISAEEVARIQAITVTECTTVDHAVFAKGYKQGLVRIGQIAVNNALNSRANRLGAADLRQRNARSAR